MMKKALRDLARERGDIKRLEGPLSEYCRLRVHGYRVVFAYADRGRIQCVFAERRNIVYEVFAELVVARILGGIG
jgi:mRNA-degrading endonuclease RelE of RelBE toxin-antitoxin system